ncbi:TPA: dTDP-glucose 4,6-dehydratase [bacterium]|nr:dTDP-glucose 4,6-dehydratase [bacterium]
MKRVLVTGGAGFIGSHFTKYLLKKYPDYKVTVFDALTYAGNLDNFDEVVWSNPQFNFRRGNICDRDEILDLMEESDVVVHFAAETHVDRSIDNSDPFIATDVKGTQVMLEVARSVNLERFIHISTSEVYGSAEKVPMTENHALKPMSPYAACKAAADRLIYAYFATYELPMITLRPFNNYGPNQYPEKLIPLFITNAIEDKPLPVYGAGKNTRDWLYVEDCCEAIDAAFHKDIKQVKGEVINIGTGVDTNVLTITKAILKELGKNKGLIKFITDRPGHVQRHITSTTKAERLLGFKAKTKFKDGLKATIKWYVDNPVWWRTIKEESKAFKSFYKKWYQKI